ncbi:MAG: hypothetical protein AXA67_08860 [Methylothermaceae bacteria B42]|nr:MAG: hypothetical protein AXA67_08860 [Methylothermaceae bacteria B42]HHJ39413.1 hypothetical protein [Methylothermaceae bacterium]
MLQPIFRGDAFVDCGPQVSAPGFTDQLAFVIKNHDGVPAGPVFVAIPPTDVPADTEECLWYKNHMV